MGAVNTTSISNLLGFASSDVGQLCKAQNYINKWSRWKPFAWPSPVVTVSDLADAKCGFNNITSQSGCIGTLSSFVSKYLDYEYDNINFEWNYSTPTGGTSQPFRLGDFREYDPNALPMFKRLPYSADTRMSITQYYPALYFNKTIRMNNIQPEGVFGAITPASLSVNDVSLSTYYFGCIVLRPEFAEPWLVVTCNNPLSVMANAYVIIDFKPFEYQNENLGIVFFLSPRKIEQINLIENPSSMPNQNDYIMIDNPFLPCFFWNGEGSIADMWIYDKDESYPYDSVTTNLSYFCNDKDVTEYSNIYGIVWNSGDYFTLEPNYGVAIDPDDQNSYALELSMICSNFSTALGSNTRHLVSYSITGATDYNVISIKNDSNQVRLYFGLITGVDDDTVLLTGVNPASVYKIVLRNFDNYSSSSTVLDRVRIEFYNSSGVSLGYHDLTTPSDLLETPAWFRIGSSPDGYNQDAIIDGRFPYINVQAVPFVE